MILHGIDIVDTGLIETAIDILYLRHVRLCFIVPPTFHIQLLTLFLSFDDYCLDFDEGCLDWLALHLKLKIILVEGYGDLLFSSCLINFFSIFFP